jgi:hypothetical protein
MRSSVPILSLCALAALAGCEGNLVTSAPGGDAGVDTPTADDWAERLDQRRPNYGAALRTAALRLVGELPTVADLEQVTGPDAGLRYRALIEQYLDDPRFARQMLDYWRDRFRMGGTAELDAAPAFAAWLSTEGRSLFELFTATTGTCPTVTAAGVVTPRDCANGVTTHAGVLTNPGVLRHFASNMAFRRVRWVQEVFACAAFPAEVGTPRPIGDGATYTAPWDFDSIAGPDTGGRVDFLDVSGVVCANCHASMNHIAPLFATFGDDGSQQAQMVVRIPIEGEPEATMADFLPPGQTPAWRLGVPTPDLPSLGAALAADPAVASCLVTRAWNWALGRGDVVSTLATVPPSVIGDLTNDWKAGGASMKDLLLRVFTSDDFTRY